MSEGEGEEQDLIIPPDQFRCVRTDGKQWRCKEWQYQDSNYCEKHHIQIKYKKRVNQHPKKTQLQVKKEEKKRPNVQKKKVQIEEEDNDEDEEEEAKFVRKSRKVVKDSYAFLDSRGEVEKIPLAKRSNENANNMNSSVEIKIKEKKTNVQIQENEGEKKSMEKNVQKGEEEEEENEEEEEKLVRKRRKVAIVSYVISDSREDEVRGEIPLEKKINESNENLNSTAGAAELSLVEAAQLISVVKDIEECTTSELVFALKTAFRYEEFEKVEHILKLREEKIIMDKKEAEEQASRFKQILAVSGIKCAQLSNELLEKNKEITSVERKLKESELRKQGTESELLQYKRMCEELQSVKSREENEIDGLKKRVKELETQSLLHYRVSRKEYAEEGKKSGSTDSRIQSAKNNASKGVCLPYVNVKEEALDCDGRVYVSPNVDSICHSSRRDCGVAKHAEPEVKHGSKAEGLMMLQLDGGCSKMLSPPKLGIARPASEGITGIFSSSGRMESRPKENLSENAKEEALNCDGRVYASSNADFICHHSAKEWGAAQVSGSSANQHSPVPTVSTGGGIAEEFLTPSRRRLVSMRQPEFRRTGAQNILLNHFETSGISCKESESSTAGKEAENFESARMDESLDTVVLKNESNGSSNTINSSDHVEDGITKFLSALRRSKKGNLESTEIMKITSPSLSSNGRSTIPGGSGVQETG